MPVVRAVIHPPHPRPDRPSDTHTVEVAARYKIHELLCWVFQVFSWTNYVEGACPLLSWFMAEEGRHWILNCHLNDQWNFQVSCWHRHQDPHCGLLVAFTWCWKGEQEEEKYDALVSGFKKAVSDKFKNIQRVTLWNINEFTENEFKRHIKESNCWYDEKHHRGESYYPVNDCKILASPTTHGSNSLDGWQLGTNNGSW